MSVQRHLRVIHEVVDLPHGHAPHVDEEDEAQQHQVVFWRHPQYKLQVEGVQLGQQELRRRRKTRNPSHIGNTISSTSSTSTTSQPTMKMMPSTASQRRTVDAGFHSNLTQL